VVGTDLRLHDVGEADAEVEKRPELVRGHRPRREADLEQRLPETVLRPGVVAPGPRRRRTDGRTTDDQAKVGGNDVVEHGSIDLVVPLASSTLRHRLTERQGETYG
jgi:hypothetical protein